MMALVTLAYGLGYNTVTDAEPSAGTLATLPYLKPDADGVGAVGVNGLSDSPQ